MLSSLLSSLLKSDEPSDASRTIEEIIEVRGFKAETHKVTTNDGYILTVNRIVNPLNSIKVLRPVLLWHGFAANSAHWIINSTRGQAAVPPPPGQPVDRNGVDDSLGFALSNAGYDVWMANGRGNKYSLDHEVLDYETDPEFWDFGVDEQIANDLPAIIAHILRTTRRKSLGYVGMSMGNTIMTALLASKPMYNEIVRPFIAMAPVVSSHHIMGYVPFAIKSLVLRPLIAGILALSPGSGLGAHSHEMTEFLYCGHKLEKQLNSVSAALNNFLFTNDMKTTRMYVIGGHQGCHFSRKSLAHLLQVHLYNRLQMFDYGKNENLQRYGTLKPTLYNLENISSKHIALIHAKNDAMVKEKDLERLRKKIQAPLLADYRVENENYSHLDFSLGRRLGYFVNWKVVEIINSCQVVPEKIEPLSAELIKVEEVLKMLRLPVDKAQLEKTGSDGSESWDVVNDKKSNAVGF